MKALLFLLLFGLSEQLSPQNGTFAKLEKSFLNSKLTTVFLKVTKSKVGKSLLKLQDSKSACKPDWTSYQPEEDPKVPEKCIKVFANSPLMAFREAKRFCADQEKGAQLLTITSFDEQSFINELLFEKPKKPVDDNVWIGAGYFGDRKRFMWTPRSGGLPSPLGEYSYWSANSPKHEPGSCVRLTGCPDEIQEGTGRGKWHAESCYRENLVVCEVIPSEVVDQKDVDFKRLVDAVSLIKDELKRLEVRVAKVEKREDDMSGGGGGGGGGDNGGKTTPAPQTPAPQTPVPPTPAPPTPIQPTEAPALPVGFIYLQIPQQKSPQEMFPKQTWADISSNFPGLFFRVVGGDSKEFGAVQEENVPTFDAVAYVDCLEGSPNSPNSCNLSPSNRRIDLNRTIAGDSWTTQVTTANFFSSHSPNTENWTGSLKFHNTGGPVRPRNTAIRVWVRTA